MKITKILLFVFGIIIITLYLMFMPQLIHDDLKRNVYREWREIKSEGYAGVISVWHVVSFKPHTGSISAWLERRASTVENKHQNIYFNIIAMTKAEYDERIMRGESADIYSFALGDMYPDRLYCMSGADTSAIREPFLSIGTANGDLYALPYAYSGYALISNTQIMSRYDANALSDGISGASLTESAKGAEVTDRKGDIKTFGLTGNRLVAAYVGVKCDVYELEGFTAGNAALAISDFRAVGDAERRIAANKGNTIAVYSLTDYTDMVQLVGIDRSINEQKIEYASEFIASLFDEKAQAALAEQNLYSVISTDTNSDEYTSIAQKCYEMYRNPIVPNAFLFNRYKEELNSAANLALSGDSSAIEAFLSRMNEVFP